MNALETNTLLINSINEKKNQQSIRLMEFINMYNLKRDEIVYLCPLLKNQLKDEEFELEVQCLEELADVQIIYNNDRKNQLSKIRVQEQKIRQRQAEANKNKSSQGFFGRLFGGKNNSKERPQSLTPTKLKIDHKLIRSSSYLKSSSPLKANQLYSSQIIKHLKSSQTEQKIKSDGADIPKEQKLKTNFKKENPFKDQLIEADENHLLPDLAASISPIAQADQDEDSQVSRISSVTRLIAHENNQINARVNTSRSSKRNTILDDSDENQEEQSIKVEPLPLSMKKKSNSKHVQSSEKLKVKPTTESKDKTPKHNSSDSLDPYIPKDTLLNSNHNQNQSGSSLHSQSPQFSRLSESKIVQSRANDPSLTEQTSIIEDPAVILIKKIQACELREKILTNRLKERWNKQQQQLGRIRKITLQSITPEIKHDPQLRWAKPNFNFGKIID